MIVLAEMTDGTARFVDLISYDGNKYCEVSFDGHKQEIKAGYLHKLPCLMHDELMELIQKKVIEENNNET